MSATPLAQGISDSNMSHAMNPLMMKSHNSHEAPDAHKFAALPNSENEPGNQTQIIQHKLQQAIKLKIDKSLFMLEQKGKIKARYRVLETLGKGSYGEVKKIQHKASGEYRAMKIICKEDVSQQYVDSLLNEIDILKQLDHPNIVKLYEFYQDKVHFYLITEYIDGGELFDKISQVKSFSEEDTATIMK